MAYASAVVGGGDLVPNASALGPGYKIIGTMPGKPQQLTTDAGLSWTSWSITFVISDLPFVNGSTTAGDLSASWIEVFESVPPGNLDSYQYAESLLAPQQVCQTFNNDTQSCTTVPSNGGELLQIANTWLAVNFGGTTNAGFILGGQNLEFLIDGENYTQTMALAESVIHATA